jgi:hypothetical protein
MMQALFVPQGSPVHDSLSKELRSVKMVDGMEIDQYRYFQAHRDQLFGEEASPDNQRMHALFDPARFVYSKMHHRWVDKLDHELKKWVKEASE